MALTKDWRTIIHFALVGLALGIVGSASSLTSDVSTTAVTFLLCPAALLCAPLFAWAFEAAEAGRHQVVGIGDGHGAGLG